MIVKVVLHDDRQVPPDVLSMGSGQNAKIWTVPVYILSRQDMIIAPDEQPIPPNVLAHPVPPEAPRWMGPIGEPPQAAASEVGEASARHVHDALQQMNMAAEVAIQVPQDDVQLNKNAPLSPAAADFAALGGLSLEQNNGEDQDAYQDFQIQSPVLQEVEHEQNQMEQDDQVMSLALRPPVQRVLFPAPPQAEEPVHHQVLSSQVTFTLPAPISSVSFINGLSSMSINLNICLPSFLHNVNDSLHILKVATEPGQEGSQDLIAQAAESEEVVEILKLVSFHHALQGRSAKSVTLARPWMLPSCAGASV